MQTVSDIAIFSIFGRGNWLAAELADAGLSVQLIDLSNFMGRWGPEDWEGPFGFFHAKELKGSQIERLNEEDYYDPVDQGFTVWLKSGPIDLKGSLSQYILEQRGLKPVADKYLIGGDTDNQELSEEEFDKSWLVYLAHQLAANSFEVNSLKLNEAGPLPVFAPLHVRRVTRRGAEKSLKWCEQKGVQVYDGAMVKDISLDGKNCESIEIESAWSGAIRSHNFVWMLTGEECEVLPKRVTEIIYPNGILQSKWSWLRYRIKLGNESSVEDHIPLKFVMIEDLYLPWTHANLCMVQKTASEKDFDVWVKLPKSQRFQKKYIEEVGQQILTNFDNRVPNCQPEIVDMPQDYHYSQQELGPARTPVYDDKELKSYKRRNFKNLYFENPEDWKLQDWSGQFASQNKLVEKIFQWKNTRNAKSLDEVQQ